jgi:class 3 adenylate cyclase/streptogramin lyase
MQRRTVGVGLSAVLFTDIVGSTPIAAEMGNTRYGELVARHHRILRRLIGRFGGHEIDTAGDGFFVSFERPADAIRCAVEASESVRELGIELRAGVSFGEVETMSGKPGGLVVNTAARVMSVAGPGEVLVPSSVRDIVPGSGIMFAEHGVHQLKGLEGDYRLFKVTGVDGKEVIPPPEAEEAAERRREIFPTGAGRRGPLIAGLVAGALAVIVVATLLLTGGTPERPSGPVAFENAVGRVDPETGRVVGEVALPAGTEKSGFDYTDHPFAVGEGGAWLLRPPVLLHVDPRHHEVREPPIQVGLGSSQTVATGFDAVWVLSDRTVLRVNPATDEPAPFLVIPARPGITAFNFVLDRAIWVSISDGTLIRLDPRTQARAQVNIGLSVDRIAATTDAIWAVDLIAGQATPFDRETLERTGRSIRIEGNIDQITGEGHDLWVLDRGVGTVTRIDTRTGEADVARVGMDPTDMAFGLGAVWVGDRGGSLFRVDPATLATTEIPVGAEVRGVAVDDQDGSLWVYVGDRTSG